MKKLLILTLLLIPSLVFAQLTKDKVTGTWTLVSRDHHYLSMVLNRKGFVRITESDKKHKRQVLPLGIWSTLDDQLNITIYGKTKFHFKHVTFHGNSVSVLDRHGKTLRFTHKPLSH